MTIDRAEAPIGLPSGVLRIPPYHCCGPAFQLHPLRWTDKALCRFIGARQLFVLRSATHGSLVAPLTPDVTNPRGCVGAWRPRVPHTSHAPSFVRS